MAEKETQEEMQNFERLRNQLYSVSAQKQQMEFQNRIVKDSIDALKKSNEKQVYKAVGNILINTDKAVVESELEKQKEEFRIRIETLEKQEKSLAERLSKIKAKLEGKPEEKEAKETKPKDSKTA